jgi:hypothetical protein
MFKKVANLFKRNKDMKTYVIHLTSGRKIRIRAKDYEYTYFSGKGTCASIKFVGAKKRIGVLPASVAAIVQK